MISRLSLFVFLIHLPCLSFGQEKSKLSSDEFVDEVLKISEQDNSQKLFDYFTTQFDRIDFDTLSKDEIEITKAEYWLFLVFHLYDNSESELLTQSFKERIEFNSSKWKNHAPQELYEMYILTAPHIIDEGNVTSENIFQEAEKLLVEFRSSLQDTMIFLNSKANYLKEQGAYDNMINTLNPILNFENRSNLDSLEFATCLTLLGDAKASKDEIENSIDFYGRAYDLLINHPEAGSQRNVLLNNMAGLYAKIGDNYRAIDLYKKAIALHQERNEGDNLNLSNFLRNIGIFYNKVEDLSNSKAYLDRADEMESKLIGDSNPSRAITWNQLADLYNKLGQHHSALEYGQNAIHVLTNTQRNQTQDEDRINAFASVGEAQFKLDSFENCKKTVNEALEIIESDSLLELNKAIFFYLDGKSNLGLEDTIGAKSSFLEALKSTDETKGYSQHRPIRLKIFEWLAKCYSDQDEDKILTFIKYKQKATNELFQILHNPSYLEERYLTSAKHSGLFYDAIRRAVELNRRFPNDGNFILLDHLITSSKQKDLLIELRKGVNQNDEVGQLELLLAHRIDQKALNPKDDQNLSAIIELQQKISKLKNRENIPLNLYQEPIANFNPPNLEKDQIRLNYYESDDGFYLTYFAENHQGVVEILFEEKEREEYESLINNLRNNKIAYYRNSYEKLSTLLLPAELELDKYSSILINASGSLSYLSFDILLFQNEYLIKSHDIAYEYGHSGDSENREFDVFYTGIAPSYRVLPSLSFANQEINNVKSILGDGHLYESISKETCIQSLFTSKICHFACHAQLSDSIPLDSKLILDDGGDMTTLSLREVSRLKQISEFIVLSACNSGNGYLYQSDGVASLAKAFALAGTKTVLTSLWNVNDNSSLEINTKFFQYLISGHSKSKALRMAKLDYLDNVKLKEMAHPFFWANYKIIGDDQPLSFPSQYSGWAIVLLLIVTIAVLFYFRRAKRA